MTSAMIEGRRAESTRRRQRVVEALRHARTQGTEISVSGIARMARVDRSFLYRHKDLLNEIHSANTSLSPQKHTDGVTTASIKADLANAQQRLTRLATQNRQLEQKLSALLGEQAWRDSGLGAPADIDQLQQELGRSQQRNIELSQQLDERNAELAAARAANRELIVTINKRS